LKSSYLWRTQPTHRLMEFSMINLSSKINSSLLSTYDIMRRIFC